MLLSAWYHLSRFAPLIVIINAYFTQSVKLLHYEAKEHFTLDNPTVYLIGIELQLPLMDFKNTISKGNQLDMEIKCSDILLSGDLP